MSRSKGGVVLLASQSPDDFEGAEDGYLDNMDMTLAFNRRFASRLRSGATPCALRRDEQISSHTRRISLCSHASRRTRRRGSSCLALCSWHGDGTTTITPTARPLFAG